MFQRAADLETGAHQCTVHEHTAGNIQNGTFCVQGLEMSLGPSRINAPQFPTNGGTKHQEAKGKSSRSLLDSQEKPIQTVQSGA